MLELVTARARTRGKAPVEFTYQAVGRLRPRAVKDKEGKDVLRKDGSKVEVDDVETFLVTDSLQDVIDLYGTLNDDERKVGDKVRAPLQCVIDYALEGYNQMSRDKAAPVSEQVVEDELTPITVAMVEYGVFTDTTDDKGNVTEAKTHATTWRRAVTQAAALFGTSRLEYAQQFPQYKALLAKGWKPAENAA